MLIFQIDRAKQDNLSSWIRFVSCSLQISFLFQLRTLQSDFMYHCILRNYQIPASCRIWTIPHCYTHYELVFSLPFRNPSVKESHRSSHQYQILMDPQAHGKNRRLLLSSIKKELYEQIFAMNPLPLFTQC